MESIIYNQSGKEVGKIQLPEKVFGLSKNADLVHQVVQSMLSDARTIYAHTKDRGEVSGGGKKPWQQKGLGRARHGSTRSQSGFTEVLHTVQTAKETMQRKLIEK